MSLRWIARFLWLVLICPVGTVHVLDVCCLSDCGLPYSSPPIPPTIRCSCNTALTFTFDVVPFSHRPSDDWWRSICLSYNCSVFLHGFFCLHTYFNSSLYKLNTTLLIFILQFQVWTHQMSDITDPYRGKMSPSILHVIYTNSSFLSYFRFLLVSAISLHFTLFNLMCVNITHCVPAIYKIFSVQFVRFHVCRVSVIFVPRL